MSLQEAKEPHPYTNSQASNSIGGDNVVLCALDGGVAINGDNNTINEASVILRFLSIIEEQGRTIARLQEEVLRLSGLRLKDTGETA